MDPPAIFNELPPSSASRTSTVSRLFAIMPFSLYKSKRSPVASLVHSKHSKILSFSWGASAPPLLGTLRLCHSGQRGSGWVDAR